MIELSGTHIFISVAIATLPSVIVGIVSWVRLGPRVSNLEKEQESHARLHDVYAADLKATSLCLMRLTTLQEVAERRLERLEAK